MSLRLTRPLLTQCLRTQQKRCAISCSRSLAFTASKEHVKSGIRMTESRLILGQPQIRQFAEKPASHTKIENMVIGRPLVVFMKGTPEQPMCGFSNAVCQILRMHGVPPFDSYNVLEDEEIRQGIKEFSNWPTIPQVYIGGEFVGGCDIMIDMHKNGELIEELKKVGIKSDLDE